MNFFPKNLFAAALALAAVPAFAAVPAENSDATASSSRKHEKTATEAAFDAQMRDAMLANVNGEIITVGDVRRETMRYVPEVRRTAGTQREFQQRIGELMSGALQSLTDTRLLVSAFDDSGAMMDDNFIEQRINDIIEQDFDGDRSKYLQMLRQTGSNPLADKRRMRDRIKAQSWDEHIVQPAFGDVSPERVKAEYEARIEEFRSDAAAEYAQIVLFAGASENDAQVEALAKRLREQLRKGETDFETAAKIFSRDDYRAAGGYVGWKPLSDLSEQIVPALRDAKDGEISEIIPLDSPAGKVFVILKRIAFREAGVTPLKDVRAQIENRLRAERAQQLRAEKMAELRDEYYLRHF